MPAWALLGLTRSMSDVEDQDKLLICGLLDHTDQYMSTAQKGIGNNIRNSKHQLLIDTAVAQESTTLDMIQSEDIAERPQR